MYNHFSEWPRHSPIYLRPKTPPTEIFISKSFRKFNANSCKLAKIIDILLFLFIKRVFAFDKQIPQS